MDALELLKADHDRVKKLLSELEDSKEEPQDLRELYNQIKLELKIHEHLEETLLYPVLREHSESRQLALEGFVEHHTANVVLNELALDKVGSDNFKAKAKVLKELVEHHIEEEEGELFDQARELLGEERLSEMGQRMQDMKARELQDPEALTGEPVPRTRDAA